ncbi:MAG TPA: tRNA lysidine(34) synthetase TilS, partial [Pirellulaceae bacterium]|nr:tRNA lysidine(34) synthetase TilS [Pirellulaceae bacterium]
MTTLIAVSGGADSVALLRAMAAIRNQLSGKPAALQAVHFHHGLRGSEADADAKFVQELAAQCELKCVVGRATSDLAGEGDSVERAAREARYAFFTATANATGARYLLTAHTADDQAETILHRVLRGTGVAGLAGIPRVRRLSPLTTILRPLLDT